MTMMYMYSGLPLLPYFPMVSAGYAPQCGQTNNLPAQSRREDFFLSGHKSVNCPMGVLTDPQADGLYRAVLGEDGNGDGGRVMRLLAEGCSSSTTDRRASSKAAEERLPSAKDNNQLKFSIDRILGNCEVSATRTTDNKNIDTSERGDSPSFHANETAKRHWEILNPMIACNAWRRYTCDTGSGTGYTTRSNPSHDDNHPGKDLHLPSKFCQRSYQDLGLSSVMLHSADPWSYAQYRLDHNAVHPSKEPYPPDLPHHKQPQVPNPRVVGRRKRSWSRAVFTSLQRKGLEKRFSLQKYVNKPDRRQLAAALGLTDAQVKVWFQNRRMKWRHNQRVQKQQRQAADTSSEGPGLANPTDAGMDGEDQAEDRDSRPAVGHKDELLDQNQLVKDGFTSKTWLPK